MKKAFQLTLGWLDRINKALDRYKKIAEVGTNNIIPEAQRNIPQRSFQPVKYSI